MGNCIRPESQNPRDYYHGITPEVYSQANNTWDYHWNHDRVMSCIAAGLPSNLQTRKHRWQVSLLPLLENACLRYWKHENNEKANVELSTWKLKLLSKDCVWSRRLKFFVQVFSFFELWKTSFEFSFPIPHYECDWKFKRQTSAFGKHFILHPTEKTLLFPSKLQKSLTITFYVNYCSFVCKQVGKKLFRTQQQVFNYFSRGSRGNDRKTFSCNFEKAFMH